MNQSIYPKLLLPTKRSRGFTLIELLVVVAVLALLAATLLPALAANKRNPKMVQCLSNLRQIGMGCSVYAADFNGWYPLVTIGGFNSGTYNHLGSIAYTRYIYADAGPASGDVMPRGYALGGTSAPFQGVDQNLGYLYGGGMIPDGHAFFCPGFADAEPSSPIYSLSADYYSTPQFMSTHLNSVIRSSYLFNLRMNPPVNGSRRAYQKVADVKQLDVFCMDYLSSQDTTPGVPFTPDNWAHWPYKGLPAGFTDGSARFCIFAPNDFNTIIRALNSDPANTAFGGWAAQYNTVLNWLRDAP